MREYKFRAWNKNSKKMYKIGQITLEKGIWNYEPDNREYIGMSIPYQPSFILMQYTGLKDENGKEIYEGDILLIDAYTYEEPEFSEEYLVEYNELLGMWQLKNLEDNKDIKTFEDLNGWYKLDIKLLGNKFDNPKLLEEGE